MLVGVKILRAHPEARAEVHRQLLEAQGGEDRRHPVVELRRGPVGISPPARPMDTGLDGHVHDPAG